MKGIHQIAVKRQRGRLTVQAIGRTTRGVKFILGQEELTAKHTTDPRLKAEQTAAADKLLGSDE